MSEPYQSEYIQRILNETPEHTKRYVALCMDISDQIATYMKAQGLTNRDLADKMGTTEEKVAHWLSGTYNFTLRKIAKIEATLGETILVTPLYYNEYKENKHGQ